MEETWREVGMGMATSPFHLKTLIERAENHESDTITYLLDLDIYRESIAILRFLTLAF